MKILNTTCSYEYKFIQVFFQGVGAAAFETWLSCGSLLSIRDVSLKNFTPVSDKCTHQAPVLHHLSHGNGHLDQDSRLCMFARLRDPAGNNIDNKMLYFQWIPLFPSQKSFDEVVRKVLPGNWK